jgi:hypothetical protein
MIMGNKQRAPFVRILYLIIAGIFYVAIFAAKFLDRNDITKYLIPLFVLFLFIYTFIQRTDKTTWLLTAAMFFVLAGDILLNWAGNFGNNGVFSFMVTHICLAVFFLKKYKFHRSDLILLVPILFFSAAYYLFVYMNSGSTLLHIVLAVYLLILSLMVWRAILAAVRNVMPDDTVRIFAGAVMFYFTDLSVFLQIIYTDNPALNKIFVIITWLLYPPALTLIGTIGKSRKGD